MATCSQTDIPILNQQEDLCNGVHTSTNCVFYPNPITYLFVETNDDLTTVINAIVLSLQGSSNRISQLEEENASQQSDIEQLKDDILTLQQDIVEIQQALTDCCL